MFDSSGDSGPPCGVPSVLALTTPSCIIPAARNRRISFSTRTSSTRRATRDISTSWFTRSKNFSRSMSTTQRLPSPMYACACFTACAAERPGRKP